MKGRGRVLMLGVVLVLASAWVLLWPAPSPLHRAAASTSVARGAPLLPALPGAADRSTAVQATPAEAPSALDVTSVRPGAVADADALAFDTEAAIDGLIVALLEAESADGAAFHRLAVEILSSFVGDLPGEDVADRQALGQELLERLDGGSYPTPVHGALLALLGAWGRQQELLQRLPAQGEGWRSTVAGLSWQLDPGQEPWGRSGVALSVDGLQQVLQVGHEMGGLELLPIEFVRRPDDVLVEVLLPRVTSVAGDFEELLDRDVALLALGTSVDDDVGVLGTLRELLFSSEPLGLQVRYTVLYVLTRARSRAARSVVQEWVDDDGSSGEDGRLDLLKARARAWLADHEDAAADFDGVAAVLLDEDVGDNEKIGALIGLSKTLEALEAVDRWRAEELLAELTRPDGPHVVRLGALSMLAGMEDGGQARVEALGRVLDSDGNATARLVAARGLGRTGPPFTGQAQALLRGHLPEEADERVREAIEASLADDG